jgi:hypothetical protein
MWICTALVIALATYELFESNIPGAIIVTVPFLLMLWITIAATKDWTEE